MDKFKPGPQMKTVKTSIAMTTYNGEQYLDEQLQSFLTQTILPNELVIVDDLSTDNTIQLLYDFQKTAPFDVFIYKNKSNLGYTQNFSKALSLCTGELIFLSDQDDVWMSNKIELLCKLYIENPDNYVFMHDANLTDQHLEIIGITVQQQFFNTGLHINSFVLGCCIAVKRDFIEQILPIPEEFIGHDNWIVELTDMLDMRFISDEILMYYRRHNQNTSNTDSTSLNKLSQLRLLTERFSKSNSVDKMSNLLKREQLLLHKLEEIKHAKQNEAIRYLENKIQIRKKRLKIVSYNNIFSRLIKSLYLYLQGDYKYFSEHKSLIADILKI